MGIISGFVILEWGGSTSMYQRGFTVAATGVWYHFSASLADEARHQWTAVQSFVATNVTQTIFFTNDAPRQFWRMVRP